MRILGGLARIQTAPAKSFTKSQGSRELRVVWKNREAVDKLGIGWKNKQKVCAKGFKHHWEEKEHFCNIVMPDVRVSKKKLLALFHVRKAILFLF